MPNALDKVFDAASYPVMWYTEKWKAPKLVKFVLFIPFGILNLIYLLPFLPIMIVLMMWECLDNEE